jgi:hypothetical protein
VVALALTADVSDVCCEREEYFLTVGIYVPIGCSELGLSIAVAGLLFPQPSVVRIDYKVDGLRFQMNRMDA